MQTPGDPSVGRHASAAMPLSFTANGRIGVRRSRPQRLRAYPAPSPWPRLSEAACAFTSPQRCLRARRSDLCWLAAWAIPSSWCHRVHPVRPPWLSMWLSKLPVGVACVTSHPERGMVVSRLGLEPSARGLGVSLAAVHGVVRRWLEPTAPGMPAHRLHPVACTGTAVAVTAPVRPGAFRPSVRTGADRVGASASLRRRARRRPR
jgi:hypothetical protein